MPRKSPCSKFRVLVDGAGQECHRKRAPAHEANAQLFADRQDVRFRVARHHGVFVLNRRDGLHRVRAAERLRARFREAEMQNLPLRDQILDSPRDVLRWEPRDRHGAGREDQYDPSCSRFSMPSTANRMCSGRLLRPPNIRPVSKSMFQPNFEEITT